MKKRKEKIYMLPYYKKRAVTEDQLTQDIIIEALEREDVSISVETARQTCFLLTQLHSNMKVFEEEFHSDPYHKEYPAEEMANFLVRDVEEILRNREAAKYKERRLTTEKTVAAMNQAGIEIDVDLMESLLAAYAIGGKELLTEEWLSHLREQNLTADGIAIIASYY